VITNIPQKQNEHHGCMWNSDNQALTSFDHKHGTEAEWAPWVHVEFWQSSTHILWSQTWHRSRMGTMDACGILNIKHSQALITNMAQKQNEHHGCMWNSDNQALTYCDHKHSTEAEWAPWMHVEFWQSGTHRLWLQTWHSSRMSTIDACGIQTMKHSHTVITNMAQKQNEHHGCMWYSHNKHSLPVITNIPQKQNEQHGCMWYPDNQALTSCDYKHSTEREWAPWMHVEFWKPITHLLWSQI